MRLRNQKTCGDEATAILTSRVHLGPKPRGITIGLQEKRIHSLGSLRSYVSCLRVLIGIFRELRGGQKLKKATIQDAKLLLEVVAEHSTQETVNQYRAALQRALKMPIPHVRGQFIRPRVHKAYRGSEAREIIESLAKKPKQQLAVMLVFSAGLRASELAGLRPIDEQPTSPYRPWRKTLFDGIRDFESWTVAGKGGLIRRVAVPAELGFEIRKLRFAEVEIQKDRGINRSPAFDLPHGKALTSIFSRASKNALGFSFGIHSLRHTYLRRRQLQLYQNSITDTALRNSILAQELGHFRPSITNAYY
jgi:integrase